MKKLRLALLPLLFCASSAFAFTQTDDIAQGAADGREAGRPENQVSNLINQMNLLFTGTPVPASNGTLQFWATGDRDNHNQTADTFYLFGGAPSLASSTFVTSFLLDNYWGNGHDTYNNTSIPIPQATLASLISGGDIRFWLTNSANGVTPSANNGEWLWLSEATLSYTPVPLPAALPLFIGGLLVLARTAFRRKPVDEGAATA